MALAGVAIGAVTYILVDRLFERKGHKDLAFLGSFVTAIAIGAIFVVATVPELRSYITGPVAAPAAAGPTVITQVGNKGYVPVSVSDLLKIPATNIAGAEVYVSTSQPVAGASWIAAAQDNTGSNGSVTVTVPGVSSGLVYVTAYKPGFYSEFGTAIIPGPEILPSTATSIKLENVGDWSVTVTDNSNAVFDGENIIENSKTSTTSYFTLNIATSEAFSALKNIRLQEIRGDAYSTLGAVISPIVLKDGECLPSIQGDPTLTSASVGGYDFSGNLNYGQLIQVKFIVTVASAGTGTIARISLNDLLGSTGYLNETGVAEKLLYIKSVA
jgi:hypothetical protein